MCGQVAAGVVIAATAIGLAVLGLALQGKAMSEGDREFALGWVITLVGGGLAVWTVFFKAHF